MWKDLYRIEYFDGEWTVRGEDGWGPTTLVIVVKIVKSGCLNTMEN